MTNKKLNAALLWKQVDDLVVPTLRLSVIDRAVYSYLLRHSRLEGKDRLRFSLAWLARGVRLSVGSTRHSIRRLLDQGALRLLQRSKAGHLLYVCVPDEIRSTRSPRPSATASVSLPYVANLEETDFLKTPSLRAAIHARERGVCFYCLRRLTPGVRCLDHVVPQAAFGRNSYRNLVSCCLECNSQKGTSSAPDFLRRLYRDRRLTAAELHTGLQALDALAAGKLRPPLSNFSNSAPRKGRPPLRPGLRP